MSENLSREQAEQLLTEAAPEQLPSLIERFSKSERAGIRKLAERAAKQLKALEMERERMDALFAYERQYPEAEFICGVDEVGRGPWAGPVMAGAVILPKDCDILYINDSKKLSEKKREELYEEITAKAIAWAVGCVSPERIDEINILQATYEAMRQAIDKLSPKPDLLLIDAVKIPRVEIPQVSIVKGDAKSASIGAASIVAKVTRDRLMVQYDELFPEYYFAENKGYGTAAHIEALSQYGPTPIHRRSFIKNYV